MSYTDGLCDWLGQRVQLSHSALLALLLILAFGAEAKPVKVVYVDFKPYTFTNEQGEADGLLNQLTRKVLAQAGIEAEFQQVELLEMFESFIHGDADISFMVGAFPVRKHKMLFGSDVIAKLHLQIYFTDAMAPVRTVQDLRGKSVAILKSYTYGYMRDYLQFPENRVQLLLTDNHRDAFELLASDRSVYVLDYRRPVQELLREMQLPGLMQRNLSHIPIYWAVSKRSALAGGLLSTLESTYGQMLEEGLLQPID